jgi:sulfite exporter TauE/SafE
MCDCARSAVVISELSQAGTVELIIRLFLFGVTSSFTHCIGMCGAIAMGQSALRMMDDVFISNLKKIQRYAALEYYFGKTITYAVLTSLVVALGNAAQNSYVFVVVKGCVLFFLICYFVLSSLKVSRKLFKKPAKKNQCDFKVTKSIEVNFIKNKILSRIIIGICLGLIPCSVVYASIGMVASSTNDIVVASLAALSFGIGTFPGLFLISYSGNLFFFRFNRILDIVYLLTLLWNISFLMKML